CAGDFNSDGILDIASANYYRGNITILPGTPRKYVVDNPPGSGVRSYFARGRLYDNNDTDFYSFSAQQGDVIIVSCETENNPEGSELLYQIYGPGGNRITYFYSDYRGWGQSSPINIIVSGTYFVQVSPYYDYRGEYRISVISARQPFLIESESNNDINSANTIYLERTSQHLKSTIAGFIHYYDDSGDFYKLGYQDSGTIINLSYIKPDYSLLNGVLEIYNSRGILVAASTNGATNLTYTIPQGSNDNYYARIRAGNVDGLRGYLYFDNNNSYVRVGSVSAGSKWSVEAWAKPSSTPSGRKTIAGSANDCRDWGITMQDGYYGVMIRPPGGCSTTYLSDTPAVIGEWVHLLAMCDGTNAYLYVNGILKASGMVEVNYNPYDDFWIRGEPCCGGNGFPGSIDNVRLWNKVLSYTEIMNYATNREPQIAVDEPGLVGYWKFDEVGGNIAYDFSINGKNGIINGTPIRKRDINGVQAIGLTAQYLISLDIVDTKSPQVISDSLPTASSTDIISSFIVKYSEDMNSSTINNSTNYDLRSAGIDGIFDTQDDEIYTVNPLGYTAGLTASYTIPDGPLQPGQYRFIVKTNIQDKFLNPLLTNYVKYFTVISIPGIVNETRNNNTIATATPLGV
ncbi:MAG: LamG-like jellyroll fold domain-containing protein, partial [Verrucomicrobiia bacterium]